MKCVGGETGVLAVAFDYKLRAARRDDDDDVTFSLYLVVRRYKRHVALLCLVDFMADRQVSHLFAPLTFNHIPSGAAVEEKRERNFFSFLLYSSTFELELTEMTVTCWERDRLSARFF